MGKPVSTPAIIDLPADGQLVVPMEQLQQAGFAPGDRLVLSTAVPGQLYIHKAEVLLTQSELRESLKQLIQEAFRQSNYHSRDQIVALVREVRQEIANER
jgi:hypothetical protein